MPILPLLLLLFAAPLFAKSQKPNIIYILVDDAGYNDFSGYGQKKFKTPHIDQLQKEGMHFTRHYSGSTVCAPTRSALLTGQHTGHTPIRGNGDVKDENGTQLGQNPMQASAVTIPEILKKAGYTSGVFGKWGLGFPGSPGDPLNQGFDRFYGYNCQWNAHTYYPEWMYDDRKKILFDGKTYTPPLILDEAKKWIREKKDKPFFAYLALTLPHAAMHVPEEFAAPFRKDFPQYEGIEAEYLNNLPVHTNPAAQFAGMMTVLDNNVGDIMKLLKELKIDDNTLVIFTSDNGPHIEGGHLPDFFDSNGPYRGYKRDLYEGGIRVPLIARWPSKIKAGTSSGHPSAHWDTLATFCEIVELPIPEDTDGISFLPTLFQQPQKQHDYLYWEFPARGGRRAASFGPELNWKAVQYDMMKDPNAPIEIYRLDQDPGETKDLAKKHPEKVAQAKEIFTEAHTTSGRFPFQWEKPKGLTVSLISESKTIVPGQPLTLGLHIKHQPGFHTYWKSPGQVGVPTSIDWTVPEGFEVSEISWPSPEITYMADYQSHGYKRDVTLLVTLTPPTKISEKAVTISAKTNWMCCAQSCHPDGWEFFLNLPISAATQPIQQSAKLIEKARTEVPTAAKNWQATLLSSSDESPIRILLSGTSTETPSYFFSEDGQISSKHKQEFVRKGPGFWELTIERAEYSPKQKKSLPGVLKTAKGSFHIQPHYLK